MKAAFSALILAAALLAGCGGDAPAPAPAPVTEPAPAPAPAPAPEPAAPAASSAENSATPGVDESAAVAPAEAQASAPAPAPTPAAVPADIRPPRGPAPREGVDYTLIDPPAPYSPSPGKIEVVEVFAYTCIHCSTLQGLITPWKKTLPADVEFRYAPTSNGAFEPFARAFYAAEAMGEHERTHEAMFKAIAVERRFKTGTAEEIADLFAETGVDEDALLATMRSFAVNAQIARNQKALTRWAIEGTPTMIVNGRYKISVTGDRGHDGMISTAEHLVARERAARGTPGAP